MSTITGTSGNDYILGTPDPDFIEALEGDDSVHSGQGSDTLYGGRGNDILNSLGAGSSVNGGDGNDLLSNYGVNSTLYGENGDDVIGSDSANSYLNGGDGNDTLLSLGANSTLDGGDGIDALYGLNDNNTLNGGGDNDWMMSLRANNILNGGQGSDFLYTNADNNIMNGGEGNDGLESEGTNNSLYGGDGNDSLWTSWGSATMNGGLGNDRLYGAGSIDHFVYAVNALYTLVTVPFTESRTFAEWLVPLNLHLDQLTQSQFATQYEAWTRHLVDTYAGVGADLDGDGVIAIGLNPNDPSGRPTIEGMSTEEVGHYFGDSASITVKTGKTTQERYLANEFSITTTREELILIGSSSPDGHDVIKGFMAGQDALVFQLPAGLSLEAVKAFLEITEVDADNDGAANDTLIHFAPAPTDWSVTLIGATGLSLDSVVAATT